MRVHGEVVFADFYRPAAYYVTVKYPLHRLNGRFFPIADIEPKIRLKPGLMVSFVVIKNCAYDLEVLEHNNEIRLSEDNWDNEIGQLDLPGQLKDLLRSLVSDTFEHCIMPNAEEQSVRLAKEHLANTIITVGRRSFSVAVYVPDDNRFGRCVFILIPNYPKGTIRRLEEF